MRRFNIIQTLIDEFDLKSYLEIGVDQGECFDVVKAEKMVGVDPDRKSKANVHMTSDNFFYGHTGMYDIILIDGMHEHHQVLRDANNAMRHLNPGGFIVFHDMTPHNEPMQRPEPQRGAWTGNCWRAWVDLRQDTTEWDMFVLDTDYGCGIMTRGYNKPLDLDGIDITYENFARNMTEWLNLKPREYLAEYINGLREHRSV